MSQNLVSSPSPAPALAVAALGIPTLVILLVALFQNWGR